MANPWCSTGSVRSAAGVLRSQTITSTSIMWPRKNGTRSTSHPLRRGYTRFLRIYLLHTAMVYVPVKKSLQWCVMFFFLCLQVSNLTSGSVYEFRVYAANVIGLGDASAASAPFKCEAWNMPEPGNKHQNTCILASSIFQWVNEVLCLEVFVMAPGMLTWSQW